MSNKKIHIEKNNGKKLLSEFKFYSGNYSKFLKDTQKYETWEQAVERVMNMHRLKYSDKLEKLEPYLKFVQDAYNRKLLLGSQRALQFGFADKNQGILKHNSKIYNCLSSYADRPAFFQEAMYWLLSGCGIGFRIFQKDIDKYKKLNNRNLGVKTFVIEDSIEGWSDAFGVLISSYLSFEYKPTFPEFQGYRVDFDYSLIRKKGALISGGFKAPGPDGLRNSILKVEQLIQNRFEENSPELRTIDVYDILMHMSDAVLSGGVRRSASICLFHKDDELLLNAKTGDWYQNNPQRARSNNSVLLLKNDTSKEEFDKIFKSVQDWGEPGFVWTDSYDITYNPCVEIGKYPQIDGISGWQGCNLTEINGGACATEELFYEACEASAIMGTLQAGYTDFNYVDKTSPAKAIFERESLLGCSITGFTNNPEILFNPEILKKGALILKEVNSKVSEILGINKAARLGCVKPSGNASVLLETASGIHGEHSKRYLRNVQVNKEEDIPKFIRENNPSMFEDSVWSNNNTDWVASFPVTTNEGSLYKDDLLGVNLLDKVKIVQKHWVEASTNYELCVHPKTRHNVSNTINVINWEETKDYIYENRQYFAGISLLSNSGDKDYNQAPFTSVLTIEEIVDKYGEGSMFASGLIVDGLHVFNNNLWQACDAVLYNLPFEDNSDSVLKKDWVRRFKKFANNYLDGDYKKTSYLLKDVYLLHKWNKIIKTLKPIDWSSLDIKPTYTDISTTGALACSGGSCELFF
jgi:ribonucleoside-triphosphate reductase